MWLFGRQKIAVDDLRRLTELEDRVNRYERQLAAVLEDVDEYFRKINKARQRVVKQDADAASTQGSVAGGAVAVGAVPSVSRAVLKEQIRARMRSGA